MLLARACVTGPLAYRIRYVTALSVRHNVPEAVTEMEGDRCQILLQEHETEHNLSTHSFPLFWESLSETSTSLKWVCSSLAKMKASTNA